MLRKNEWRKFWGWPCGLTWASIERDNKRGSRHHQSWDSKNQIPSKFYAFGVANHPWHVRITYLCVALHAPKNENEIIRWWNIHYKWKNIVIHTLQQLQKKKKKKVSVREGLGRRQDEKRKRSFFFYWWLSTYASNSCYVQFQYERVLYLHFSYLLRVWMF